MIPKTKTQNPALLQEASSLLLVTALCGAGGALTTAADAAIVATPGISPSTPLNIPTTTAGVYLNALTGVKNADPAAVSGWDINLWGSTKLSFFAPTSPLGGVYADFAPGAPTNPGNLPQNFVVGATTAFTSGAALFGTGAGQWMLNAANYFGFRFTAADNNLHYGYGRIIVGAAATSRTLVELYYEDKPGTGIAVGALPIPEPTGALLAAGAAGLMALRRRRQAA